MFIKCALLMWRTMCVVLAYRHLHLFVLKIKRLILKKLLMAKIFFSKSKKPIFAARLTKPPTTAGKLLIELAG